MQESNEQQTEEQTMSNLQEGIILAIEEKREELEALLPLLSKNELKRTIKNMARFPRTPSSPTSENEAKVLQALFAVKDLQVEMAILSIGEKQKEIEGEQNVEEK